MHTILKLIYIIRILVYNRVAYLKILVSYIEFINLVLCLEYIATVEFISGKNLTFLNVGADIRNGMSTFWISPDVNLSSIIKQNSLKYGFNEDELIETKIETRTIDSLINEYNIDWLRLDTEGMDYNLINSISINNLKKLKYIQYEHVNITEDEKISLNNKKKVIVLINGNDEIIWIINHRIDDRYKITESSKKILKISFNKLVSLCAIHPQLIHSLTSP